MNRLQLQALSGVPLAIDERSIDWLRLNLEARPGDVAIASSEPHLDPTQSHLAWEGYSQHRFREELITVDQPGGKTKMIAGGLLEMREQAVMRSGQVAVVPVVGVFDQRPSWFAGVSTDRMGSWLRELAGSKDVKTIVMDIDSPGGSVFGVEELAQTMQEIRAGGTKIVAVANSWAASAAYYVASQADELVVTPGGMVGSVGVYSLHVDASKAYEEQGYKVEIVKAGKFKAEGNEFEPLGDEARSEMQRVVDAYYAQFVKAVAKGRGTTPADVRDNYGQGRMVLASDAVKLGMADRVDTLAGTLARLTKPRGSAGRARAEAEALDLTAPEGV